MYMCKLVCSRCQLFLGPINEQCVCKKILVGNEKGLLDGRPSGLEFLGKGAFDFLRSPVVKPGTHGSLDPSFVASKLLLFDGLYFFQRRCLFVCMCMYVHTVCVCLFVCLIGCLFAYIGMFSCYIQLHTVTLALRIYRISGKVPPRPHFKRIAHGQGGCSGCTPGRQMFADGQIGRGYIL